MTYPQKTPAMGGSGFEKAQTNVGGLRAYGNAIDLLLSRLDRVKQVKPGSWIACCPAHEDRHPSLGITETKDGTILLHDFAGGCDALAIVHAVGLELADLFPNRPQDRSPMDKRERREAWKVSGWRAALGVLAREATVVGCAAGMLRQGHALTHDDDNRLTLAMQRIEDARGVLL